MRLRILVVVQIFGNRYCFSIITNLTVFITDSTKQVLQTNECYARSQICISNINLAFNYSLMTCN